MTTMLDPSTVSSIAGAIVEVVREGLNRTLASPQLQDPVSLPPGNASAASNVSMRTPAGSTSTF